MKRVGSLLLKMAQDRPQITGDGMEFPELYKSLKQKVATQIKLLNNSFETDIKKELTKENIHFLNSR